MKCSYHIAIYTSKQICHCISTVKIEFEMIGTWWYWVSMGQYWMVLDDIWGGTGWYLLAGLHKLWNPRIPDLNT